MRELSEAARYCLADCFARPCLMNQQRVRIKMKMLLVALAGSFVASGVVAGTPGDVLLQKPMVGCPQSQFGDGELQTEYKKMWLQYEQKIEQETKVVEDEICRLYEQARMAGHLDLVLFWKDVQKGLAESGSIRWEQAKQKKDWGQRFPQAEFPESLTAVLQRCVKGYADAKMELEAAYENLVATLTRKDMLDEAGAIRAEVRALWSQAPQVVPPPSKPQVPPKPAEQPKPVPPARKPLVTRMIGSFGHPNLAFFVIIDDQGTYTEVDKKKGFQAKGRLVAVSEDLATVKLSNGGVLLVGMLDDNMLGCVCENNGKHIGDGVVMFRLAPGAK
jgi:hypothetical protein